MVVDSASILGTDVVALAVQRGHIYPLEKHIQQLVVAYLLGVKRYLDSFSVARHSHTHCLVGRVGSVAAGVSHGGLHNTRDPLVG